MTQSDRFAARFAVLAQKKEGAFVPAEAGGMGKAARPQSGAQDHYPQGHAGTVSDGQSGKKSSEAR